MGIVSIIPTIVGIVRGRMHKGEKNDEEARYEEDKVQYQFLCKFRN